MAPSPHTSAAPSRRWFPSNRRDGSRLLSTALVISGAGLVRLDHPLGRLVFVLAGLVSLFWWRQYRRLSV
ncbi:MAG: hypothetical protein ACK522_06255 [Synechococcaceae cyanobacterium]|jgi:hypothetical protein